MNYPTVTTKFIILLGNPLGHSISPPMHNRVFEKLGLDYCYLPVQVTSENLKTVFTGLSKMNVAGFNVTIPHKISIIEHLDTVHPLAATIGAVNTICVKDGKTIGHNTDGEGFIQSLEEEGKISVRNKRIFLLGCGGAARAIAITLAFRGVEEIFICNRTLAKAEALAAEINEKIRNCAKTVQALPEYQSETIKLCDILVNGTSLGMHPRVEELPISEECLFKHLVVADIVYNPHTTRLLALAHSKGCKIVHGLGMLIYQGAAGFKLWTGVDPLIPEMTETAYALMAVRQSS
ncbi:MAG: shikimate dehydrogenase [Proteobacteria bacterium]|nr:shikimate dehydrogenase [Pseudomonadota bacterium]